MKEINTIDRGAEIFGRAGVAFIWFGPSGARCDFISIHQNHTQNTREWTHKTYNRQGNENGD